MTDNGPKELQDDALDSISERGNSGAGDHLRYYSKGDKLVVLRVDGKVLYNSTRHLLARESAFFASMFALPQGKNGLEEGSDEHPFDLLGVSQNEANALFNFLYNGMHIYYAPTIEEWIDLLSIADRLLFDNTRKRAIKELTARQEDINASRLIKLSYKYSIQEWLLPACVRIVSRDTLLQRHELAGVPAELAFALTRARERWAVLNHQVGRRAPPLPGVKSEVESVVEEEIRDMAISDA